MGVPTDATPVLRLNREVPPKLTDWLVTVLPEATPPFECARVSGGYSMLTYRLSDRDGRCWVLRHPPAGNRSGRAHDTDREARVMGALAGTAVPVPRVRAVGTSSDPLGLPCHVTDFVPGHVLGDAATAERLLAPDAMHTASIRIVEALATLHSVDPDTVGLGDFGRREGYVSRQLRRWRSVVETARTPETTGLAEDIRDIADLLDRNLPPDNSVRIMHGDFRLGNAIVGDDGEVRAILDWELSSLGDPLADLATLAAFWHPSPEAMLGERMPTTVPSAIGADDVLARYQAGTGTDLSGFWFYETFASWRLACTALRAYMRYASGAMGDSADLTRFTTACASWIAHARKTMARH